MFNYQTEEINAIEELHTCLQAYDGTNWELVSTIDKSTKMNTIILLIFKKNNTL